MFNRYMEMKRIQGWTKSWKTMDKKRKICLAGILIILFLSMFAGAAFYVRSGKPGSAPAPVTVVKKPVSAPGVAAPAKQRPKGPRVSVTAYIVQSGDTTASIAKKFGISESSVIGSNKLSDILDLKNGTILRIPDRDGVFLRISSAENLSVIASDYGTTVQAITKVNGLGKARSILPGSEIFIPGENKILAYVNTGGASNVALTGRKMSAAGTSAPGLNGTFAAPAMITPLRGQITSAFGWRPDPLNGMYEQHAGIDISAPEGSMIRAAAPGRVTFADSMDGYGKTLIIEHYDGYTTLYGHCSRLLANVGDTVQQGQTIAKVGSTGRSTGNHLHFEVRRNGVPVDPSQAADLTVSSDNEPDSIQEQDNEEETDG